MNRKDRNRSARTYRDVPDTERRRYRQESIQGDWSEDWGRPVDENRITAVQRFLIICIMVLLILLMALGVYWMFLRTGALRAG